MARNGNSLKGVLHNMMGALYPTKKALKEKIGQELKYEETSFFGPEYKPNGTFSVVGPSPYKRNWFATVTMKDGKIEKVS
jgi:hypothetical protein